MLGIDDVRAARDRVTETARRTPLERSHTFSEMTGADVRLKLETFQRTGAFKIRGATNRIATLPAAERAAGIVTASAGNHAQGVALAASRLGVDATVVMPEDAPVAKVQATRDYGAEVLLHGTDYDAAAARAHEIERQEGRYYLHAFDDWDVIAGQGTLGLEVIEDCPDAETVVVPVGGGGLVAGVATAVKGIDPSVRVVGVEATGAAGLSESLARGERVSLDGVDTIADGIATRSVGEKPFAVIREHVDEVVTVDDADTAVALTYLLERSKVLVEPAGAIALAAILAERFDYADGETVVAMLCGGNVDMNTLTTIVLRGLVETGRYLRVRTTLPDRPGALGALTEVIADHRANIYAIRHERTSRDVAMNDADVELSLETRGPDHVERLLAALEDAGYDVDVLV
ncbi:MAG: threonine ammonia-lyase [Salinirussus sp.]